MGDATFGSAAVDGRIGSYTGGPESTLTTTPSPDVLGTGRAAGLELTMIKLCERCFAPVEGDANVVRLAHIDAALAVATAPE